MRMLSLLWEDDLVGVRFSANVFISSILVWFTLSLFNVANPIWALSSMVASSEPEVKQGIDMFRSRLINTLVGSAIGLGALLLGEPAPWVLPFALALAVLLSSYVVRIKVMWRQAPITAAVVIAGSLSAHSRMGGIESGLRRVAEVIFGCVVALAVSWLMARVWPIRQKVSDPT